MCISFCLQNLVGDAIVVSACTFLYPRTYKPKIHRTYIVWQSLWIVAIPFVLWLGVVGTSPIRDRYTGHH
jgi:hypothetical protein